MNEAKNNANCVCAVSYTHLLDAIEKGRRKSFIRLFSYFKESQSVYSTLSTIVKLAHSNLNLSFPSIKYGIQISSLFGNHKQYRIGDII